MRQLTNWTKEECAAFGLRPLVAKHRLHEVDLFSDDALIALLDRYPRNLLRAFTMGTDPLYREWSRVDPADLPGNELFAALRRGRLWFNLPRVDLTDRRYGDLLERLLVELSEQCPHLKLLSITSGNLLISSPGAMLYYHLDPQPQALWHIRGTKRAWVYPACDDRFVPQEIIEDFFAGTYEYGRELKYSSDFDDHAVTFNLQPGDVVSWPQNAPHRVLNLGTLNVSFLTTFLTKVGLRRTHVYLANRFFRRWSPFPMRSTKETGPASWVKCLAYRVCRRAGLDRTRRGAPEKPTLRVNPTTPLGVD